MGGKFIIEKNTPGEVKETLKNKIKELRKRMQNPFLIIYEEDEELELGDLEYLFSVLENMGSKEGSLIISGNGGHFSPAIDLGIFLKQKFMTRLEAFIPKQASSAFGYVVLLSNEAVCCNQTPLSQFDLTFYKNSHNQTYRAKEELKNKDQEIGDDAKFLWSTTGDILRNIMSRPDSLFQHIKGKQKAKEKHIESHLIKLIDVCMRDKNHSDPIRLSRLKALNLKIGMADEDLKEELIEAHDLSQKILKSEHKRFLVGNDKILLLY